MKKLNIDKENNIAYVEGRAYRLVPIEDEKVFICEIDGKKYYLGPEAVRKMDWYEAGEWAKDVGGVLMSREVAIMAYKKDELRKHFHTDGVYWLDEEYNSSNAWIQGFGNGVQGNHNEANAFYVRAIFVE